MTRSTLLAATILTFAAALPAVAQPVSGLYIGAGGGANFLTGEYGKSVVYSSSAAGPGVVSTSGTKPSYDTGYVGLGSVGYGLGNGLRLEIEGNYRYNRRSAVTGTNSFGGREEKYGPMANVLFDLDVGSPYVFPYIGAGAGYQWVRRISATTGNINFALPNNNSFLARGVRLTTGGTDSSFAYQAIAGLSFPIPPVPGLSLTAEYRYLAMTGVRQYTQTLQGGNPFATRKTNTGGDENHSLLIGLRYAFNTMAPAVAAPSAPAPAVREASRSYLVFFDWDRADLTDRARAIVNEAAQATTRVAVTRIEVSGHTDKSGTAAYNQGLSQRRASVVAAELVRLGVPRQSITTQAFGESRPLVPTADGVREPQNRRVEIVLR